MKTRNVTTGKCLYQPTETVKESCRRVAIKWEPFLLEPIDSLIEKMLWDLQHCGISVISNLPSQKAFYIGGMVKTKGIPDGKWLSIVYTDGIVKFKVNGEDIDIY